MGNVKWKTPFSFPFSFYTSLYTTIFSLSLSHYKSNIEKTQYTFSLTFSSYNQTTEMRIAQTLISHCTSHFSSSFLTNTFSFHFHQTNRSWEDELLFLVGERKPLWFRSRQTV